MPVSSDSTDQSVDASIGPTLLRVGALLVGTALLLVTIGLVGSFVPAQLAQRGTAGWVIGLVGGVYFAGLASGSFGASILLTGVGHVRTFTALSAVMASSVLAIALSAHLLVWLVARFAIGAAMGGLYVVIESWLTLATPSEQRGRVLAVYQMAVYGGLALGQLLLAVPDPSGTRRLMMAAATVCLAAVPVALTRSEAPPLAVPKRLEFRTMTRLASLGLLCSAVAGLSNGAIYGVAPAMAEGLGYDDAQVVLLMLAFVVGGVVFQWPVGKASDLLDRRLVIAAAAALGATAAACGMWVEGTGSMLLVAGALGATMFSLYPVAVAYTFDRVSPEDVLAASTALLLVYFVASAVGAVISATALGFFGPAGFFVTVATPAVSLVLFSLFRAAAYDSIADDEKLHAFIVPRTSPLAAELDPRVPDDGPDPGLLRVDAVDR